VAIYYYNGGYIVDEIFYRKGVLNKEIADTLLAVDEALVIADSANPQNIEEIKLYGVNIIGANKKGKDSVLNGINYVQEQKISVTKRSINVIKEYRNYLWKVDKNGNVLNEPEHEFSHSMDAIRYALVGIMPNIKSQQQRIGIKRDFDPYD